jgi:tetratricopeptide (TPR) repeat protein
MCTREMTGMPMERRNDRLERLITDSGMSRKSFARAVLDESALAGGPFTRCDHTDVGRWISGMIPRGRKPAVIAAALSRKLGRRVTLADIGMAAAAVCLSPELGLNYPAVLVSDGGDLTSLWRADLDQATSVTRSQVDPGAWTGASFHWLVASDVERDEASSSGGRVGTIDVERFRETVGLFVQLDNRYGGGHARRALIQYLATDGERLLRGRYVETVGSALFPALGEATLLAAWMAYDSAPASGLAQRYFIQALALAQAGNDRLLGASILDAMSHQATFVGRFREAADLARAARSGTRGLATPTLTAHFYAMEARALARLGDERACDLALSRAASAYEQRNSENDPEWIKYFDEAELAAEFGHCLRDLGRHTDASRYAEQCVQVIDHRVFTRSDFFATMVLADAHLKAGEIEQACTVALNALTLGEQLRSARCVNYLREFRIRLAVIKNNPHAADFQEQANKARLWRIASCET